MKSMTSSIRRFLREEDGAAAVEYGLLVALIALAVAAVVITLGTNLKTVFTKIGTCVATPSAANCTFP
jgi:pilus assembly protein Flp/PilA